MYTQLLLEAIDELYFLFKDTTPQSKMSKQEAYDRYQNANTDGTLIGLNDTRAIHDHFVETINSYTPPLNNPIVTKQEFLEDVLHRTFHLWWSANNNPPGFGVGNPALFMLRRNETSGEYDVRNVSLTEPTLTESFNPSQYLLHLNSLMLMDGQKQFIIKRTTKRTQNGSVVWNAQYMIGSNLIYNYYLVDFQL